MGIVEVLRKSKHFWSTKRVWDYPNIRYLGALVRTEKIESLVRDVRIISLVHEVKRKAELGAIRL